LAFGEEHELRVGEESLDVQRAEAKRVGNKEPSFSQFHCRITG